MKSRYLDVMARVVDVYDDERFENFITRTRANGISEHGFPRLCANIGILMAHGRKLELRHRFEEMMEICCRDIPVCPQTRSKRGNDFSVRELTACILELENANLYPPETTAYWKQCLTNIEPKTYYRMVAPEPPVPVDNWAAFNAASEMARCAAGLANSHDYIENQIASQMLSFDENGMYRDPNDPMVYDIVTRNMLSTCLYYGYNGAHKAQLEAYLRKAGKLTLLMQSVTGELPYGGRSNQFLHNEAHLTVCMEYEASVYKKLGDSETASKFKAAANHALDNIEHLLKTAPDRHIKNFFPTDSMIGCEKYAYYDKYMVTIASFLYLSYLFCDDTIPPSSCPATENGCYTWQTGNAFRKVFCKAGEYFMEMETKSDRHYDAEGIGRIHRRGAPSPICLSVPASKDPNYGTPTPNDAPLAICCGKISKDKWVYGYSDDAQLDIRGHSANHESANVNICCIFSDGSVVDQTIMLTNDGVCISLSGDEMLGLTLPAFYFDGMTHPTIAYSDHELTIRYKEWKCVYATNGIITDTNQCATNRNGTYRIFRAQKPNDLQLSITIVPDA